MHVLVKAGYTITHSGVTAENLHKNILWETKSVIESVSSKISTKFLKIKNMQSSVNQSRELTRSTSADQEADPSEMISRSIHVLFCF